jgi:hypothetical protein
MRRHLHLLAATAAAAVLLVGCGDADGSTGTSDADADTQTEGNRESEPCLGEDAATGETIEEPGDDPMGSTESEQTCTEGNGDQPGGDGDVDSGGPPGVGTP